MTWLWACVIIAWKNGMTTTTQQAVQQERFSWAAESEFGLPCSSESVTTGLHELGNSWKLCVPLQVLGSSCWETQQVSRPHVPTKDSNPWCHWRTHRVPVASHPHQVTMKPCPTRLGSSKTGSAVMPPRSWRWSFWSFPWLGPWHPPRPPALDLNEAPTKPQNLSTLPPCRYVPIKCGKRSTFNQLALKQMRFKNSPSGPLRNNAWKPLVAQGWGTKPWDSAGQCQGHALCLSARPIHVRRHLQPWKHAGKGRTVEHSAFDIICIWGLQEYLWIHLWYTLEDWVATVTSVIHHRCWVRQETEGLAELWPTQAHLIEIWKELAQAFNLWRRHGNWETNQREYHCTAWYSIKSIQSSLQSLDEDEYSWMVPDSQTQSN